MNEIPAGETSDKEQELTGTTHLLLYPKEPTPQMVEIQLWLDIKTGFIRRAQVMDFYGNTNRITFTAFHPDNKLSVKEFSFVPPQGTEVEDHREDGAMPGNVLLK